MKAACGAVKGQIDGRRIRKAAPAFADAALGRNTQISAPAFVRGKAEDHPQIDGFAHGVAAVGELRRVAKRAGYPQRGGAETARFRNARAVQRAGLQHGAVQLRFTFAALFLRDDGIKR